MVGCSIVDVNEFSEVVTVKLLSDDVMATDQQLRVSCTEQVAAAISSNDVVIRTEN